jgi:drug/metabolite transporter (DMT)-like permease
VLFLSESINAQNIVGFAMILLASVFVTRESVG